MEDFKGIIKEWLDLDESIKSLKTNLKEKTHHIYDHSLIIFPRNVMNHLKHLGNIQSTSSQQLLTKFLLLKSRTSQLFIAVSTDLICF